MSGSRPSLRRLVRILSIVAGVGLLIVFFLRLAELWDPARSQYYAELEAISGIPENRSALPLSPVFYLRLLSQAFGTCTDTLVAFPEVGLAVAALCGFWVYDSRHSVAERFQATMSEAREHLSSAGEVAPKTRSTVESFRSCIRWVLAGDAIFASLYLVHGFFWLWGGRSLRPLVLLMASLLTVGLVGAVVQAFAGLREWRRLDPRRNWPADLLAIAGVSALLLACAIYPVI